TCFTLQLPTLGFWSDLLRGNNRGKEVSAHFKARPFQPFPRFATFQSFQTFNVQHRTANFHVSGILEMSNAGDGQFLP
ncbi:MAG TPA: hypothetical protein VMR88_01220, partial [Candidatus Polarisedimenticolaceae bacterium]|nr:hypothetical protein [Candidatus Polarisedimenticolaceae bacterium]